MMITCTDGPATLRRLGASPATAAIPVIMVTAATGTHGGPAVSDQAVTAVIPKPFDITARQVAAALGWEL